MSNPTHKSDETRTRYAVSTTKPAVIVLQELFTRFGQNDIDIDEACRLLEGRSKEVQSGNLDSIIEGLMAQATALRWLFSVRASQALALPPESRPAALEAALAFQTNELRSLELVQGFLQLQRQPLAPSIPVMVPKSQAA